MSEAPAKPGDILAGRYRVEKVLASGAMGVVVAAEHVQLGQKVAVKFLLEAIPSTDEAAHRFEREAKAAARLRSEHIARVRDVGNLENGAPYLVMEFLEGEDLETVLRAKGSLPVEEAVEYVLQALEGLGEAHLAGIVHRDLKPGNLFRTARPDGSPVIKVLDFGISKLEDVGPQHMTNTSAVLGSPLYMSPEQMESAKDADARSDIWSMGVVLHRLLTGTFPFRADSIAGLAVAIATKEATRIRSVKPELPEALEQVILECLAKSPGDRYANVAEFAAALAPFAPNAAMHVERLQRLFKGQLTPERLSKSDVAVPTEALGQTEKGVTSGVARKKVSRTPIFAIGVVAVVAAAFGIAYTRPQPQAPLASQSQSNAVAAPPPPQTSIVVIEPAPTASAAPVVSKAPTTVVVHPRASASASAQPSASSPPPPRSTNETQHTRK